MRRFEQWVSHTIAAARQAPGLHQAETAKQGARGGTRPATSDSGQFGSLHFRTKKAGGSNRQRREARGRRCQTCTRRKIVATGNPTSGAVFRPDKIKKTCNRR